MKSNTATTSRIEVPQAVLRTLRVVGWGVIVLALYFGREILAPLALATLLAFALSPAVRGLQRLRLPRSVAVTLVVLSAVAALAAAALLVSLQAQSLSRQLPVYQANLDTKVRALRVDVSGNGALRGVGRMLHSLDLAMEKTTSAVGVEASAANNRVQTVKVQQAQGVQRLVETIEPYVSALVQTGVVLILVIFLLLEWNDLRDRMYRLGGVSMHRMTDAMTEAGQRLRSYLGAQIVVNTLYGLAFGVAMGVLGVPGAMTWGLMAGLLRFVPYAGPVMAAGMPLAMSLVADPGWGLLAATASVVLVMELITNNLVEPLVFGQRAGLGTVAILISATFWTALWGPIGLVLSIPISVCLAAMGKHIHRLSVFNTLLASGPALSPQERVYQRLLDHDDQQVQEVVQASVAHTGRVCTVDEVLLAALHMTTQAGDGCDPLHRAHVVQGMHRLVDWLEEQERTPATTQGSTANAAAPAEVWVMGSASELDAVAARLAAWVLRGQGIRAQMRSSRHRLADRGQLTDAPVHVVICALGPVSRTVMRQRLRKLDRTLGKDALWLADLRHADAAQDDPLQSDFVRGVANSCGELVSRIHEVLDVPRSHQASGDDPGDPGASFMTGRRSTPARDSHGLAHTADHEEAPAGGWGLARELLLQRVWLPSDVSRGRLAGH
jgi:predicted PurR-regulated permease PerM